MIDDREIWVDMLTEASPIVDHRTAEILYHRAAAAWAYDQTLAIPNGIGGTVDLTELFEQFRMYLILKGNDHGKETSRPG